jgi:cytoskeletal protein RodZ
MADDTRRAYAQSARGEPAAGWGEPSLGGGDQRESVGERLKRERETYGLHLREVSESLRIRYAYLDAIERSAFDELPGPTYAVGFVRGYAQFLGLDDDRIVQRFKDESQGLKRDQELHFPEPVNEGKIPGGTILVLSIALIAAAYGAWAYLSDGERSVADLVPEVPESLQRMVGATEEPPVPEATDLTSTRTSEPATGVGSGGDGSAGDPAAGTGTDTDTASEDTAGNDTAGNGGGSGTGAGGVADDLETEQVAELPETAPDPALSGEGDSGTPGDGAPDTSAGPGAPDVPDADTGAPAVNDQPDASGDAAASDAGQTAAEAPDIPDSPSTQSAAGDADAASEAAGEATQTPAAPDGGGSTVSQAQAAEGGSETGGNPAPPAVPEMQQDDSGIPTAPQQTQTASTAADSSTDEPDGRTFGASPANSRVTLVATSRSWVQVRGPDDSLVLTRLLRPGDRYNVPDRQGLTLHTGNAGGLQVMVDGQEVGTLGADGEVRRGILLEPQALSAGG